MPGCSKNLTNTVSIGKILPPTSTNFSTPISSYCSNPFPRSSPEDLLPIPKSNKTTIRNSRRRGKTAVLTESP